jgi:hypothetical protein
MISLLELSSSVPELVEGALELDVVASSVLELETGFSAGLL